VCNNKKIIQENVIGSKAHSLTIDHALRKPSQIVTYYKVVTERPSGKLNGRAHKGNFQVLNVSKKIIIQRIEGPRPDLQVSLQVPKSMSVAPNINQAKALSAKPSRSHEGPILKHNLCTT